MYLYDLAIYLHIAYGCTCITNDNICGLFYRDAQVKTPTTQKAATSNPFEEDLGDSNSGADPSNPFEDDFDSEDSDLDGRDREDSIYDMHASKDLDLSSRTRPRTDSESNYLHEESTKDEPLILDMMEDHFGLPEDLSRLKGREISIVASVLA